MIAGQGNLGGLGQARAEERRQADKVTPSDRRVHEFIGHRTICGSCFGVALDSRSSEGHDPGVGNLRYDPPRVVGTIASLDDLDGRPGNFQGGIGPSLQTHGQRIFDTRPRQFGVFGGYIGFDRRDRLRSAGQREVKLATRLRDICRISQRGGAGNRIFAAGSFRVQVVCAQPQRFCLFGLPFRIEYARKIRQRDRAPEPVFGFVPGLEIDDRAHDRFGLGQSIGIPQRCAQIGQCQRSVSVVRRQMGVRPGNSALILGHRVFMAPDRGQGARVRRQAFDDLRRIGRRALNRKLRCLGVECLGGKEMALPVSNGPERRIREADLGTDRTKRLDCQGMGFARVTTCCVQRAVIGFRHREQGRYFDPSQRRRAGGFAQDRIGLDSFSGHVRRQIIHRQRVGQPPVAARQQFEIDWLSTFEVDDQRLPRLDDRTAIFGWIVLQKRIETLVQCRRLLCDNRFAARIARRVRRLRHHRDCS